MHSMPRPVPVHIVAAAESAAGAVTVFQRFAPFKFFRSSGTGKSNSSFKFRVKSEWHCRAGPGSSSPVTRPVLSQPSGQAWPDFQA